MYNRIKILILVISLFMVSSIFIQSASEPQTNDFEITTTEQIEDTDYESNEVIVEGDQVKVTKLSGSEIPTLPPNTPDLDEDLTTPSSNHASTRGSVRESPDYPNSHTSANELSGPFPQTIDGVISGSSDEDWFKIRLLGDDGSGNQVDNLTIKVNSLVDDPSWADYYDTFQLFIFGTFDYGGPYSNNKLVFMDAVGYRPRNSPSYLSEICFSRAYTTGDYYIMAKAYFGYGSSITYQLEVDKKTVTPDDRNQHPDSGDNAPNQYKRVDQDRDLFDWYKIESPTGKNYPLNFTFKLSLVETPGNYDDKNHFSGKTVHFYCEVIAVVFHDISKAPIGWMKASQSNLFNLNSSMGMTENTTEQFTYLGIFVQKYGRTATGEGPYYYADHSSNADKHMGGYARYSLYISVDYIIKPLLTDERVTPFQGRTYDDYVFEVTYKDENNHPPLDYQIQIDDRPLEEMKLVRFNYTQDNYREGAIYQYTINGVKLGEGWHSYIFYFKDNDGYAARAKMEFKGPYISDNVGPQVRITAIDSINLIEDCGDRYVNLLEIFDDVEGDPMTFTLQKGSVWASDVTTSHGIYSVRNNNTLRITPRENANGEEIVYINATDSKGSWVETPFAFTVYIEPVNDPPQIKKYLGEWIIPEDSKITDIDLNDYFHDPIEPEQVLSFGADDVENIKVSVGKNTGEVYITPDENVNGEIPIRFWASDAEDTIYNVLRLNIEPINDLPIFHNPRGFSVTEGIWHHIELTAYDPVEKEEVHIETDLIDIVTEKLRLNDRIVHASQGGLVLGENLIFEHHPTNETLIILSIKATNEMAGGSSAFDGQYKFDISAVDASGGKVTYNIIMDVMDKNDPPQPIIKMPGNGTTVYAGDKIYFYGDPGDPDIIHEEYYTYNWSSDLDGFLGDDDRLTVELETEGLHTITFEVSDDEVSNITTIKIFVREQPDIERQRQSEESGVFSGSDANLNLMILAIIILVIIFVITAIFSYFSKKSFVKKMGKEIKAEEMKLPEEVQSLLEPQKAICSYCSTVVSVVSKHRPISVTCHECGKKSVLFTLDQKLLGPSPPKEQVMQAGQSQLGPSTPITDPQYILPNSNK
ncbi:MAG: hypothetical protein JSV49_12075 [Thermoplasmata archaeon]|nr:MAG: hypothetical protein JSV49_12075 [Thermoplasmata archaeon]